jgi:predicted TIM-barrel fold metal-dependent hydrolase
MRQAVRAAVLGGRYNDWLAEFVSFDPNRLIGVAMIQMDDVGWAVRELERLAAKGFRGANREPFPQKLEGALVTPFVRVVETPNALAT